MSSNLEKVRSIFKSPGIAAVLRWSKCVHVKVVMVCIITVLATIFSLLFTLATKVLVDGAVSSNSDQLVKYALMLVGGILGLALVILFREPMKARHKRMQEAEGRLHSSVQETFVNIKLVKASLSEGRQERRYSVCRMLIMVM